MDDVTRVIEINRRWTSLDRKNSMSAHLLSLDPEEDNKEIQLPSLKIQHSQIEKNIRTVSRRMQTSPLKEEPEIMDSSLKMYQSRRGILNCLLPSHKFTKTQNKRILDKLTQSFKALTEVSNDKQQAFLNRFKVKNNNDFFLTNSWLDNEMVKSTDLTHDLIEKKSGYLNKVKYPFKLYVMNNARQSFMNCVMTEALRKESLDKYGEKLDDKILDIKKQYQFRMEKEVQQQQNLKKKKELLSRASNTNAFYMLKALRQKSQTNITRQYSRSLPRDSRFYLA